MSSGNAALYCDRYGWKELSPSDSDLNLYDAAFTKAGDPRNMDVLRWRYANGPGDASCVLLAVDESEGRSSSAGICALFGVPFRVSGEPTMAAQAIDSLTGDEHRGKGLFVWMAEQAYAEFFKKGGAVVWGFPNPNLRFAYPKYLQWQMLNPMPYLIKPLRTGYFLDMLLRRLGMKSVPSFFDLPLSFPNPANRPRELRIAAILRFDETHDHLWKAFSRNIDVCVERHSGYMNWRIFDCPHGSKYWVLGAWRDGNLVAEIIWCVEHKHGGTIGYIIEWLCAPGEEKAAHALVASALSHMKAQKADAALAWNARHSPNSGLYAGAGFLPFWEKLRPTNLYWGVRILDPELTKSLANRNNWYISYTDSDTT